MVLRKHTPAHTVGMPTFGATFRAMYSSLSRFLTHPRAAKRTRRIRSMNGVMARSTEPTNPEGEEISVQIVQKRPRQ